MASGAGMVSAIWGVSAACIDCVASGMAASGSAPRRIWCAAAASPAAPALAAGGGSVALAGLGCMVSLPPAGGVALPAAGAAAALGLAGCEEVALAGALCAAALAPAAGVVLPVAAVAALAAKSA